MFDYLWSVLYFFLPAMAANMAPVFARRYKILESWNKPLDGGISWRGKRVFGDHKTVRGVVAGVFLGALVGWSLHNFYLGLAMGVGALWGDAMKSFVKRRFNVRPGKSWRPWDQIDFVIGASIVSFPIVPKSVTFYLTGVVVIGVGSFLVSYAGKRLGVKREV